MVSVDILKLSIVILKLSVLFVGTILKVSAGILAGGLVSSLQQLTVGGLLVSSRTPAGTSLNPIDPIDSYHPNQWIAKIDCTCFHVDLKEIFHPLCLHFLVCLFRLHWCWNVE